MKFSQMLADKSDAELGAMLRDRLTRLMEAHSMGLSDEAPHESWNRDNQTLRQHRVAKDAAGSGLGSRELEETDQPGAQDDPGEFPGKPPNPQRNGASLAGDLALEEARIRQSGSANLEAELHLARIRRSDPAAVRALSRTIPGYDRILPQNRGKHVVDDDGIVVSPPRS